MTAVIDVLAFPPDAAALDRMCADERAAAADSERRARIAAFVAAGLMLAWVADVAAVFKHGQSGPAALGVLSLALAVLIVAAHVVAHRLHARAERIRRRAERRFAPLRAQQATPLLALAERNVVVSQYLRMVGRQRRALLHVEAEALQRWAAADLAS
ncbi:MAG TPA: hypothetical protein VMK32_10635 [Burkholderiaceae bacterium]|nr:hypothetical protein [Burkholderiaceae bacterium]